MDYLLQSSVRRGDSEGFHFAVEVAAFDDVLHARRRARRLARLQAGGAADLADDAGALRRLGDVAWRHRPARVDAQAAAVKIFRRLAVEAHRLLAALSDADRLQKAGAVRVSLLAEAVHLLPEAMHRGAAVLVAEIG